MAVIEEIKFRGEIRRLGSLVMPEGLLCSSPAYEDEFDVWDTADILKVVSDPNRVPSRKMFPAESWIENQRSHGSCNGYAAASAYSRLLKIIGRDEYHASGAWIYSLINGGRDQGSQLIDGMRVGEDVGYASEDTVTWDMIYPNRQPLAKAKAEAAKHKGTNYYRCKTLQALKTALAQGWPAVVAVHVGSRFTVLKGGIAGVDRGPGNHAVCVDDLSVVRGKLVYDMPNSWGVEGYGDGGRAYLTDEHFAGTSNNHAFYVLRSAKVAK